MSFIPYQTKKLVPQRIMVKLHQGQTSPISNHTALILDVHALRSYLKLICEYELHTLPNTKVSGAKDHGKTYIKVRPPLVRHLLRNRLFANGSLLTELVKLRPFSKNQSKFSIIFAGQSDSCQLC